MLLVHRYKTREDWLAARRTMLGSSDSPGILGIGYAGQSKYSIWAEKVHGVEPEFSDADRIRMARGAAFEKAIVECFALETGRKVRHTAEPTIWRPDVPAFLGASIDAITDEENVEPSPVEAKYVGPHKWAQWRQGPPLMHQVQVQHQLLCTGWQKGYLVGLCGDDLIPHEIEASAKFHEWLLRKLTDFWQLVQSKTPPEIDESEATAEAISAMFPEDNGVVIDLPEEFEQLAQDRVARKAELKAVQDEIAGIDSQIKSAMGEASYGRLPGGGAFSWKTQQRKEYTVPASESRVLRWHEKPPKGMR